MTKADLTGVPETALWNLYQRASAARAGRLDDPRAIEVLARLDYPFERFGSPYGGLAARLHAQRVRTVDTALRRVLAGAPDATVVALGEGLETQFWRVDNGQLRWLTLDLPEMAAVRRAVLPDGPRNQTLAGSALDTEWTAQADRDRPVIITAQGLLPYFERDEVHRLLTAWARLLPGAWLLFDAVTARLQAIRRGNPLPDAYQPPEWTWTMDTDELRQLRQLPGLSNLHEIPQARGDWLLGLLRRMPGLKNQLPAFPVFQARLGPGAAQLDLLAQAMLRPCRKCGWRSEIMLVLGQVTVDLARYVCEYVAGMRAPQPAVVPGVHAARTDDRAVLSGRLACSPCQMAITFSTTATLIASSRRCAAWPPC